MRREEIDNLEKRISKIESEIANIKESLEVILNMIRGGVFKRRVLMGRDELPLPHESVIKILRSQENKAMTAWELSQIMRLSRSRVSEILNELHKLGFLEKRRVGKKVFYKLKNGK